MDVTTRTTRTLSGTRRHSAFVAMTLVMCLVDQGCIFNLAGLAGLAGGGGGSGINLGGGGAGGSGGIGPGAPENTPQLPFPGAGTPPPAGAGQRQPFPQVGVQDGANELRAKHGITVRGSPTAQDMSNTLLAARQYYPQETNGLSINYTASRRSSGILGVWSNGDCNIYSTKLDVVFHEMTHHITLFGRNSRSRGIGSQTYSAASQAGGGRPASSCITRSYAQSNSAEFRAEFFTGLAAIERGLPMTFTIQNRSFNPPANVRAIARAIYNNAQAAAPATPAAPATGATGVQGLGFQGPQ